MIKKSDLKLVSSKQVLDVISDYKVEGSEEVITWTSTLVPFLGSLNDLKTEEQWQAKIEEVKQVLLSPPEIGWKHCAFVYISEKEEDWAKVVHDDATEHIAYLCYALAYRSGNTWTCVHLFLTPENSLKKPVTLTYLKL